MTSVIENAKSSFLSLVSWRRSGAVGSVVVDVEVWLNSNVTSWLVVDDVLTVGSTLSTNCPVVGWRSTTFLSIVALSMSTLLRRDKCESVPVLTSWGGDGGRRPSLDNGSFDGDTGFGDCCAAARRARENSAYNRCARVVPYESGGFRAAATVLLLLLVVGYKEKTIIPFLLCHAVNYNRFFWRDRL